MHYTYVLYRQKDGKNYIGYTNNLQARLESHQKGLVSSTHYHRPLKLIYYEACCSKNNAIKREKYLKTHYGRMFLSKRLKSDS